eukprot:gene2653-5209_t
MFVHSVKPRPLIETSLIKNFHNERNYSAAITTFFEKYENGFKIVKQDIDLASSCAWEMRSADKSLTVLKIGVENNATISRYALYNAMRSFCHENKYNYIEQVLTELFPASNTIDVFDPSDRLKWECRVLLEKGMAEEAISLIKIASNTNCNITTALRTVLQTAAKNGLHEATVTSFEMLDSIRKSIGQDNPLPADLELTGFDLRAVLKSAKASGKQELLLNVFDRWMALPATLQPRPAVAHLNQAVEGSVRLGRWDRASWYLDTAMSDLGLQPDDVTTRLRAKVNRNDRCGQIYSAIANSTSEGNASSQALQTLLNQGNVPDERTVTRLLQSLSSQSDEGGMLDALQRLRSNGFQPNCYHYTVLARFYGTASRPQDALDCLRSVEKEGLQPDLPLYSTVMEAFVSQVPITRFAGKAKSRNSDDVMLFDSSWSSIGGDMDTSPYTMTGTGTGSSSTSTASTDGDAAARTCVDLLQEALSSLQVSKESLVAADAYAINYADNNRRKSLTINPLLAAYGPRPSEQVLALFNTAMKSLGRRGDAEGTEALLTDMRALGLTPDNVTLATRLRAYAESGRVSVCGSELLSAIQRGERPNGGALSVAVYALSSAGRHSDAWRLFVHHGLNMGYLERGPLTQTTRDPTLCLVIADRCRTCQYPTDTWPMCMARGSGNKGKGTSGTAAGGIRGAGNGNGNGGGGNLPLRGDPMIREAVYAAMHCCARGKLAAEALALIKAVASAGLIPDKKLVELAEKSRGMKHKGYKYSDDNGSNDSGRGDEEEDVTDVDSFRDREYDSSTVEI